MARITFRTSGQQDVSVEADGGTLMTAATSHGVPGIEGACGGVCSCATCHVHVPAAWREAVGPATSAEHDLLEFADNFDPQASRLGCQVPITAELDGLVVEVATS